MRSILFALVLGGCAGACSNETRTPETAPPPQAVPQAAPSPAPAAAKGSAGPRVEGEGFVLEVQQPAGASVGAQAAAQVVLKPTAGYHVNKEFPTQLEVSPPAGVEVAKAKLGPSDAARLEETGAEFA